MTTDRGFSKLLTYEIGATPTIMLGHPADVGRRSWRLTPIRDRRPETGWTEVATTCLACDEKIALAIASDSDTRTRLVRWRVRVLFPLIAYLIYVFYWLTFGANALYALALIPLGLLFGFSLIKLRSEDGVRLAHKDGVHQLRYRSAG